MNIFTDHRERIVFRTNLKTVTEQDVVEWLEANHDWVLKDIEFHEGGCVTINLHLNEIQVSGDNGILILEELPIDRIPVL